MALESLEIHNLTPISFILSPHLTGQGSQGCTTSSLEITVTLARGCSISNWYTVSFKAAPSGVLFCPANSEWRAADWTHGREEAGANSPEPLLTALWFLCQPCPCDFTFYSYFFMGYSRAYCKAHRVYYNSRDMYIPKKADYFPHIHPPLKSPLADFIHLSSASSSFILYLLRLSLFSLGNSWLAGNNSHQRWHWEQVLSGKSISSYSNVSVGKESRRILTETKTCICGSEILLNIITFFTWKEENGLKIKWTHSRIYSISPSLF